MTIETLSPRGRQLMRAMAMNLDLVVDTIYAALIAHVRSARPALLTGGML